MAPPPPPSAAYVALMASLYAVCSSTLSIVNKWALLGLPYPGLVTACQFLTTAVVRNWQAVTRPGYGRPSKAHLFTMLNVDEQTA